MDTAQWPQEIVVKPMEEIVPNTSCSKPSNLEMMRRVRPQKEQAALNCPRCNSTNTKFCYYNNYSLTQPRYFCKTCKRYWTEGGSLRNIPVGGGSRKNKRSSSSSSSLPSTAPPKQLSGMMPPPSCASQSSSQNLKNIHNQGHDLNLGFPYTQDFRTLSDLIQVPNFDSNVNKNLMSSSSSSHLSALELLTTGISSQGLSSFLSMPISDPKTIYSSGFSPQELKPTLNFSLDALGTNTGRLLFPFEDLKQVSSTSIEQQNREQGDHSNGYWNGMLGGGGGGGGGSW